MADLRLISSQLSPTAPMMAEARKWGKSDDILQRELITRVVVASSGVFLSALGVACHAALIICKVVPVTLLTITKPIFMLMREDYEVPHVLQAQELFKHALKVMAFSLNTILSSTVGFVSPSALISLHETLCLLDKEQLQQDAPNSTDPSHSEPVLVDVDALPVAPEAMPIPSEPEPSKGKDEEPASSPRLEVPPLDPPSSVPPPPPPPPTPHSRVPSQTPLPSQAGSQSTLTPSSTTPASPVPPHESPAGTLPREPHPLSTSGVFNELNGSRSNLRRSQANPSRPQTPDTPEARAITGRRVAINGENDAPDHWEDETDDSNLPDPIPPLPMNPGSSPSFSGSASTRSFSRQASSSSFSGAANVSADEGSRVTSSPSDGGLSLLYGSVDQFVAMNPRFDFGDSEEVEGAEDDWDPSASWNDSLNGDLTGGGTSAALPPEAPASVVSSSSGDEEPSLPSSPSVRDMLRRFETPHQ